jgi:membrane protease YdiL (CAAX protease family)
MEPEHDSPTLALKDGEILDGSWERRGRSITAAGVFSLLLVGAIYSNGGAIISLIALIGGGAFGAAMGDGESANQLEAMARNAELMKVPLRVAVTVSQFLLMLLPTLWIVKSWHSSNVLKYIRLTRSSLADIALGVAAAACFFPLNIAMSNFFVRQLNIPEFYIKISESLFTSYTIPEFAWIVFVVCVTPAICEEIFFRGCVQRTFERTLGWWSILLTGFLFGLYHLQPLGLLNLSGLGFLMGLFYYIGKSLLPSMALHFTNNFLVTVSLFVPLKNFGIDVNRLHEVPWWLIVVCVVVLTSILFIFFQRHRSIIATSNGGSEMQLNE